MRVFVCLAVIILSLGPVARGEGTLDTSEVLKEITDKELARTVTKNFHLDPVSTGQRIRGQIAPNLAGARVGPYSTCGKGSGQRGKHTLSLRFVTDTRFRDSSGAYVELGPDAVTIEENITSVELQSAAEGCP